MINAPVGSHNQRHDILRLVLSRYWGKLRGIRVAHFTKADLKLRHVAQPSVLFTLMASVVSNQYAFRRESPKLVDKRRWL